MAIGPGSIVRLKSGGPKMTVGGKDQVGNLLCTWYEKGEVITRSIKESVLEEVTKDETAGGTTPYRDV